jgi:uncharacterized OB-fold protein
MTDKLLMDNVQRPLPLVDDQSRAFWEAGRDGVLRFSACKCLRGVAPPPQPVCRYCRSDDIGTRDVSGRGVVVGATVNHLKVATRVRIPLGLLIKDQVRRHF